MDPRDPSQRPSIFKSPDPDEADKATGVPSPPRLNPPSVRYPMPTEPAPQSGPSRRLLVAMGAGGLMLLLIGGFVAASVLRQPDDTTLAAATPTDERSATATPIAIGS